MKTVARSIPLDVREFTSNSYLVIVEILYCESTKRIHYRHSQDSTLKKMSIDRPYAYSKFTQHYAELYTTIELICEQKSSELISQKRKEIFKKYFDITIDAMLDKFINRQDIVSAELSSIY